MDQLASLPGKTFSASIAMDLREIAKATGLIGFDKNQHLQQKPLYHLFLRVQESEVPKHDPMVEPDGQWLTLSSGPLHWTDIALTSDAATQDDPRADDVFIGVRALTAFVLTSNRKTKEERQAEIEGCLQAILEQPDAEPYHVDETLGFTYYHIPIGDALQKILHVTEKFGQISDLFRNEWLWNNHPAYSKVNDQPLLTCALIGGYNEATNKGEIYFAVYRGNVPLGDGAQLMFWGKPFTIFRHGLLLRKGKNLFLLDEDLRNLSQPKLEDGHPLMQFKDKKHMKGFLESASTSSLGSWHVSLQYDGKKWHNDANSPVLAKRFEDELLRELSREVALKQHELSEAKEEAVDE